MTILDIGFNSSHDIYLDGDDLAFVEEEDIVVQRLTIRLQFLFAEWFLDNSIGVPYTQFIFEAGTSITDVYSIIRREIIETEGVISLETLELDINAETRNLTITFSVNGGNTLETVVIGA